MKNKHKACGKIFCNVNQSIINHLFVTEQLFISSSYVFHLEWFKMLWEHYFKF